MANEVVKWIKILEWKDHNVDLVAFEAWAKANCGESYCGSSSDVNLRMGFLEEPSQDIKDAIDAKWAALDDAEDAMCQSYQSAEARAAAKAAAKQSAIAALATASGLSQDQINALLS